MTAAAVLSALLSLTALVTGGGRDTGAEIARELSGLGATIAVNYRNSQAEAAGLPTPALVVVGEIAGLAATLLPGLEYLARPETVLPAGKRA